MGNPAIDDQDTIFVLSSTGSQLRALSQTDGSVLWTKNGVNNSTNLRYYQNAIYLTGYNYVEAVNSDNGNQIWRVIVNTIIYSHDYKLITKNNLLLLYYGEHLWEAINLIGGTKEWEYDPQLINKNGSNVSIHGLTIGTNGIILFNNFK